MKKRIVCFVLTLIMLISLVPASVISADAASNAVSATAIYVLKQLEGYQKTCNNGYIGYGAKCPKCLGKDSEAGEGSAFVDSCTNVMFEKEADKILREELKELDKAVNKFADKNGLSFSQNQHDALVLFSFQNGIAWTLGTGEFQTAIKSGSLGNRFLDAICKWNISEADDYRRRVEANMYLNGVYSSSAPGRFIRVYLDPNGGFMTKDNAYHLHYYDVATPLTISLAPTPADKDNTFLGWYMENEDGTFQRVTALTTAHHGKYLIARYQDDEQKAGASHGDILYTVKKSALASTTVYNEPNGTKVTTYINEVAKEVTIKMGDILYVVNDYIDAKGIHWAKVAELVKDDYGNEFINVFGWVKVKTTGANTGSNAGLAMDVTVTVTNTYVNMRKNASITAAKNGSFNMGTTLRIIDTKNGSDGFLWGQVAASADDDTPVGWIALMYTDYDSVIANNTVVAPETTIATATIVAPVNGYVNVRSEAGINNQIVGALSYGVTVDLYEVKYVNGIRWGRCSTGWFCLTYARISGLENGTGTGESGFTNYIFSATLEVWYKGCTINEFFFESPNGKHVERMVKDKDGNDVPEELKTNKFYISSLRETNGETWAYTNYGWIAISTNPYGLPEDEKLEGDTVMDKDITLDWAKYYAISDDVTVRRNPATSAKRADLMIKGTEFNVRAIVMIGESIWGYAKKEGENETRTYEGWVNLSNQNVSRNANGEYNMDNGSASTSKTVKMARVVGTDSLRVRNTGASYGTVVGTLANGTTAAVLDEKNGWYLLDIDVDNNPDTGSWVSGSYLELYDEVVGGSSNSGTTAGGAIETGMGMVANTYTGVNVRTGAGTAYPATGKILTGTTVEILEVKTVGSSKWGRTEKGWVCMDYIVMVDKYLTGAIGGNTTGSSSVSTSNVAIYTGHVTDTVSVYKNTNTKSDGAGGSIPVSDAVRVLESDDRITLHEIIVQVEYDEKVNDYEENDEGKTTQIEKRTTYWARVNEGYIFAPASCIVLDTLDEHGYTVKDTTNDLYENLNVDNIGDEYFKLTKGQNVVVTMLEIRKSDVWGYVEFDTAEGWVPMSRMTKGFASSTEPEVEETQPSQNNTNTNTNTNTNVGTGTVIGSTGNTGGSVNASGYKYTGKVINTNQVNVRATASTTANVTTTLKSGAALVIYETVISEYMAWGRCDSGWIYLYYVDLTPVGNGAVDARVVYNDNTVIYKDMGMSEATGSTYAKMAVVDIYEIVGKMARTELGWIHTDNLL